MSKRLGTAFVVVGLLLILSAGVLYLRNVREDYEAGVSAQAVLDELQTEVRVSTPMPQMTPTPRPHKTEATVKVIDGNEYIGYLSIPVLEIELPVMSDWSYDKLRIAPCRHTGAVFTDNLVIAAHNYDKHFGNLKNLSVGDEISFTDMDGDLYRYTAVLIETVAPTAVEQVLESGHDLVLYTCTYGGQTRVVVYCDYIDP